MHVTRYQGHFSLQMQSSITTGGNCAQFSLLQQMMRTLQCLMRQCGMGGVQGGRGQFGCRPQPSFGRHQHSFNPGLGGFCGGNPNVNINLNSLPHRGRCGGRGQFNGQMHAQLNGQFGCGGGQGKLQQKGKGKPISYTTRGGYKVSVNKHKISIKDPNGNEVKHWGDPHENLNGKHLKDWKGKQRTVVLGDGTKITMSADGPQGVTKHTSIYDGGQNVQIANAKNKIEHHSGNGLDTMFRELSQHDGETAAFTTNHQGDAMYYNMYNEAADFSVNRDFDWLGHAQGGKVHDFYDDPRLKKT